LEASVAKILQTPVPDHLGVDKEIVFYCKKWSHGMMQCMCSADQYC